MIIFILFIALFVSGCLQQEADLPVTIQPFMQECKTKSDCIPDPSTYEAKACINKSYEEEFEKPKGPPSLKFKEGVVYNADGCWCLEDKCVPKFEINFTEIKPEE